MLGLGLKGEDEDNSDPGEERITMYSGMEMIDNVAGLCICCRPTSRREPFPGPSSLPMAEQDGGQHMIR